MKFIAAAVILLSINGMAVIEGRRIKVGNSEEMQTLPRGVQFYDPFLMEIRKNQMLYLSGEKLVRVPESCHALFLNRMQLARKRGTWLMIKPQLLQKWRGSFQCCDVELSDLASDLPYEYGISNFLVFKERTVFQKMSFEKFLIHPEQNGRTCSFSLASKRLEKLSTEQYFLKGRMLPTEDYPTQWLVVLDELLFNPSVNEIAVFLDPLYNPLTYNELDANILFQAVKN